MSDKKLEYTLSLKDLFSKGMKGAVAETGKLDTKMSAMSSRGGGFTGSIVSANLMTNAISMAGNAVKDFAVSSVQSYMKMEMYEARMTTLLHDRKAALNAIKGITADAAKTPFDLNSLIQSNSMLIGAGESASGARKVTMDLGNAIAATGGGSDELARMAVNMGQIRSIGKASAMDVRQFMFANIPIYEMLAKSMGKTTKQVKDMDISYKDLAKALSDARKEGGMFYQGLENANRTLTGSVSNLGDAWDRLKTTMGRSQSGILKNTVNWANSMLDNLNKGLDAQNNLEAAFKAGGATQFKGITANPTSFITAMAEKDQMVKYAGLQMGLQDEVSKVTNKLQGKQLEVTMRKRLAEETAKYQSGQIGGDEYLKRRALLREGLSNTMGAQNALALQAQKDKETGSSAKAGGGALGSSVDVFGARPQNITININKLIEQFSINTTNIQETAQKIKENVSKALLEAVNDVNQMAK